MMLPGLSGCEISITGNRLIKTCSSQYASRLTAQAKKQENFKGYIPCFDVPKIYSIGHTSIEMEYINAIDAITLLEYYPVEIVKTFFSFISNFLKKNIESSTNQNCNHILSNKLDELKEKNKFYPINWAPIEKSVSSVYNILVGPCHGDLTLSNILFDIDHNRIVCIDFLDSFVESPLIDIIKLEQDLLYKWILQIAPCEYSLYRQVCWLNYLYHYWLVNLIHQYDMSQETLQALRYLNYLRILPYSKNDQQKQFLLNIINHDYPYNTSSR